MKSGIAVLLGVLALPSVSTASIQPNSVTASLGIGSMTISIIDTDLSDGITPTFEWTQQSWYAGTGHYTGNPPQIEVSNSGTDWTSSLAQESASQFTTEYLSITPTTATFSASSVGSYYDELSFSNYSYSFGTFDGEFLITGKSITEISIDYSYDASNGDSTSCINGSYCNVTWLDIGSFGTSGENPGPEIWISDFLPQEDSIAKSGTITLQIVNDSDFLTGNQSFTAGVGTYALATTVPEPGEWSMMLAGLALLQLTVWRKRQQR